MLTEGGLYIIWLSDNHFYVGRTVNFKKRWQTHLNELQLGIHGNSRMQSVFNQYRQFRPEILTVLRTIDSMCQAEQKWLDENFGKPGCLNLSSSSDGGRRGPCPDDLKIRLADALRGKKHSPERCQRISDSLRGRSNSLQSNLKRSIAMKGRQLSSDIRGRMKSAAQTRKKRIFVSSSRKGTKLSQEMRLKMSLGQQKRRNRETPDEHCNRGKIWIVHPSEGTMLIRQEKADEFLSQGWTKGRKLRFCGDDERLFRTLV